MTTIPSTGNIGIDISIALITGGAITTWLTLLFDRLSKKRQEYIDLSREKITKIQNADIVYMQVSSYSQEIADLLKNKGSWVEKDYLKCIHNIGLYLYKWRRFFLDVGYMQLDDLDSENVIQSLGQNLLSLLVDDRSIGIQKVVALRSMVSDDISINSFIEGIPFDQPTDSRTVVYVAYKTWLNRMASEPDKLKDIINKLEWYTPLISLELNLTYGIFYGQKHLKNFYRHHCLPKELLKYLEDDHPDYYNRLDKLGLI
jgi:hypothetical protein